MVTIGNKIVGPGQPCFIVAEIGINHNGNIDIAKQLIDLAVIAGWDAVKFQKRTIEVVYTPEELARPRENPFGPTNGDLKRGLEFGREQYDEIDDHCRKKNIIWFASPWDEQSVDFLEKYHPPCYKIASPSLTDDNLLRHIRSKGRPVILSTGMSNLAMIKHAVGVLGKKDLIILHCTSVYPTMTTSTEKVLKMINLRGITTLQETFPDVPIGFSSHDSGVMPSYAAAAKGACMIEKHVTLDRALWGSDQASSLEPHEFKNLGLWIHQLALAQGAGIIEIYPEELEAMRKLRRKG